MINKNNKIVFMGSPDFAVFILKGLVENKFNVVGVITSPDRPAGRGQKIKQSPVKKYALNNKLNLFQPKNLKDQIFINKLKDLNADLQIVVAFRMLPKIVWNLPPLGTFNLHASLLPNYRGAAPINWAIINGETETGVTTFFIDDKIDTGEIIMQSKVKILPSDNAGTLHDKLMTVGQELVLETIQKINQSAETKPQINNKELKPAPKLFKENCKIKWDKNAKQIMNQIRGLNPYPGAWTFLINNGIKIEIKILKVKFERQSHSYKIGNIISDKSSIKICILEGFINLIEFKFPGKKQMDVKSFLNGFSFDINAKMI